MSAKLALKLAPICALIAVAIATESQLCSGFCENLAKLDLNCLVAFQVLTQNWRQHGGCMAQGVAVSTSLFWYFLTGLARLNANQCREF